MSKTASFILGSIFGAAAGVVAGMMLAPRPGAESRAMAADAMKSGNIAVNPRATKKSDILALYEKAF